MDTIKTSTPLCQQMFAIVLKSGDREGRDQKHHTGGLTKKSDQPPLNQPSSILPCHVLWVSTFYRFVSPALQPLAPNRPQQMSPLYIIHWFLLYRFKPTSKNPTQPQAKK
jgi:hypothetical protein